MHGYNYSQILVNDCIPLLYNLLDGATLTTIEERTEVRQLPSSRGEISLKLIVAH